MDRRYTKLVVLIMLLVLSWSGSAQVLHYDRPAQYFEEALVIGNGQLGATIYGGVATNRISLNDITLWTGEPNAPTDTCRQHIAPIREALFAEDYVKAQQLNKRVQGRYSENYQPLGWIVLTSQAESEGYRRSLDIATAIAEDHCMGLKREYFASAPDSVIVVRGCADCQVEFHSLLPHSVLHQADEWIVDGYAAYHSLPHYLQAEQHFFYDSTRGIHFRTIIRRSGDLLLISNATSFSSPNYKALVRARIDHAASMTYSELKQRHIDDYQIFYTRLDIDLGTTPSPLASLPTDQQLRLYANEQLFNPDLEELYVQYGRYLLIASSRTRGVPANLQGLWNEHLLPPWSSNYTTNINLEENYWPSEPGALGELQRLTLIEWLKRVQPHGERCARDYYGVERGWCLAHNSDIWAMANPVGLRSGDPLWACWNMGGAWLSTHLWEHYAFTMDKGYLAEVYPLLKGAADFCLGWLVEHDGHLLTAPSTSPENCFVTDQGIVSATLYGGTADMAMIRQCLLDTRSAAQALGCDTLYIDTITQALDRLLPYRISCNGTLQEWYHDWADADPQHRHQSHLFGLYPGHHITLSYTPQLAQACTQTLTIKGDETTGWSAGWRVNLYARLHDSDNAYHLFRRLMRYVSPDGYTGADKVSGGGTYPNLLDAHSPFQIDGNFGGTAGVLEMLVQSSLAEGVTLLPALPSCWAHEGHLHGVRVRGGFALSFAWEEGELTSLEVTNLTPESRPLRIRCATQQWELQVVPGETHKVL